MFQLYITLGYFIPAVYIYFRVRNLFINKGYRAWYTFIYLLIVAIAPIARFTHVELAGIRQIIILASGYLIPLFLYIFLAVLLYDFFLLINFFFKLLSKEKRNNFKYRLYTLSSIIILSILVVVGGAININTIQISEYRIEVPRRNSNIENLRVAFVADFHIDRNTKLKYVNQYVRKIKEINPDILLYGGDFVEGRADQNINPAIINALKSIGTKYGAYGINGNHEYYGSANPGSFYVKTGAVLIRDEMIKIEQSFYLAGRVDDMVEDRKTVNEIVRNTSDLPVLLLDHRPTQLQEASRTPANVQFSGHTHNGQMFPLNFFLKRMYELSWGYKKIKNTHFFVTSGLRLWGPPVKTAGKSEIMLVDIEFKNR